MKTDINQIIEENESRKEILFPPYDPIQGIGSPIDRFELYIDKSTFISFPSAALDVEPLIDQIHNSGSVENFTALMSKQNPLITKNIILEAVTKIRVKHDFEFWASTCVTIWDKISKEEVLLTPRPGQRKLLKELEDMRTGNIPIRIILLKARQWGGSTLVQMYMAWIQLFHKQNWHSVIVAHTKEAARNIRGMYSRMSDKHPEFIQKMTLKPYENSQATKVIVERGNILSIGSSETPDAQRSFDIMMAHLSEVAFFKSTEKKTAEDLVQTIRASIPKEPYTLNVLESTAKGVGNFFHKEWLSAKAGISGYRPVFVAWWEIEIYVSKIDDYIEFIKSMTDYDFYLWNLGATLEGIKWRKEFQATERYSDWRMASEFPGTAEEAFQSTGRRAFRVGDVLKARKNNEEPVFIGDVVGKAITGEESLEGVVFEKSNDGDLKVWSYPDNKLRITDRYVLFADIGGRTDGADYSAIKVIDREPMMRGEKPEVAAVWRGHLDQDIFAWKSAQLATIYNEGLLAIEVNSLRTENRDTEGEHHLTVLDEISNYYPNLFTRTSPEKIKQGAPTVYGFHTNRATKPMIMDMLNACLRDDLYIEKDSCTCDEMDTYEIKDNGSYGAVAGLKDDLVMVTAGALWIAVKHLDPPREIKSGGVSKKTAIVSEASF